MKKKDKRNRNTIVITDENEQKYWEEYRKTGDEKIREALILKYLRLVKFTAGRIFNNKKSNRTVEYDDLVSYGKLGLLDAVSKYDPSMGTKFSTYAMRRIWGTIQDEFRVLDPLSRNIRQKAKNIEKVKFRLETRLGRDVTDKEIMDATEMTEDDYKKVMRYVYESSPLSLSHVCYVDDSDEISIEDMVKSTDKFSPDYIVERKEKEEIIKKALNELPKKEKDVLVLYNYEMLTLKEIGRVLDVSESRVSQLHTKARQALRYKLDEIKKSLL